ncbi:MAG: hypothetical protein ACP5N7_07335 [Candidatus Pacearchaeota archaeon]
MSSAVPKGSVIQHQILAVVQDKRAKAGVLIKDLAKCFKEKRSRYVGQKTTQTFHDSRPTPNPEIKEVGYTVDEELMLVLPDIVQAFDAMLTKDEGNVGTDCSVRAKIELPDGTSYGPFGAVTLMDIEKFLQELRPMLKEIPVCDQNTDWTRNDTLPRNILTTPNPGMVDITEKVSRTFVTEQQSKGADMTQKFEEKFDTVKVGFKTVYKWSGEFTPNEFAAINSRLDDLLVAVQDAKARANMGIVKQLEVGHSMFSKLFGVKDNKKTKA